MQQAAARITTYHRAGMATPYAVETAPGVSCEKMIRPIGRVGLYVPAGSAPLPSTALMLGVPACLAGCREVVLCTPPRKDGSADPAVLVAARLTGVHRVFKIGGAQAIAAMVTGTGTVPACDKLFGPGNSFVTEAKQQVAQTGAAAIDMPAGPSEVLVIADAGANPVFVAADLLSQAEHGPDSQVLLLSDDVALIAAVAVEVERQVAALEREDIARQALASSRLIRVESIQQAFTISNRYAPEHLILALREPRHWLEQVEQLVRYSWVTTRPKRWAITAPAPTTCCRLLVPRAPTAASVWPVSRTRSACRRLAPKVSPPSARAALTLARAEGLGAHANAVAVRLEVAS